MTALSAMLDELMGKDRDCGPDEKRPSVNWDTPETCKHFLCGFCPAELFTNTRSDLGTCHLSHDERARDSYRESSRYMKMGYEEDFLLFLQDCFKDVTRRIERNHQRLQLSEQNQKAQQVDNSENEEKISELSVRITKMLEDIEELGNQGEVDQAQDMMKVCDKLKEEREALVVKKPGMIMQDQFAVQEKQMEVCEVCGAFLIVGDAQSRVDDHLSGKQHVGYARIKATITEMKEKIRKKREKERSEIEARRNARRRSRDRRSPRRDAEKPRDSGRDRRRSRDRKTSKDRKNSRERRDADRRKRSRSRDRRRSRERRGERKRSRDRRSSRERRNSRDRSRRSRDKKRARRSRSKDKKSSRHESDRRRDERREKDEKREKRDKDGKREKEDKREKEEKREREEKKIEEKRSTSMEEGEIKTPQKDAVAKITPEPVKNGKDEVTNGVEKNGTSQAEAKH